LIVSVKPAVPALVLSGARAAIVGTIPGCGFELDDPYPQPSDSAISDKTAMIFITLSPK
jgi:hypothetical protein